VVLAWGLNFSVIKLAYQDFSPATVALLRFCGMLPVLILVAKIAGSNLVWPKDDWLKILWVGFLNSGLYMVLFLAGMQGTGATQGAIALATAPVWMSVFAVVFRQESFRWNLILGAILAFAGVALVILGGPVANFSGKPLGTLLVLASALVWAYSVIVMKPLVSRYGALTIFTLSLPGALLALIPYGIWARVWETDWSAVTPTGWGALAYLILVAGVAAFLAYYKGLADVGAVQTSLTQFFIPPTAAFFSWLILKQNLSFLQFAGLFVLIAGVFWATRRKKASETDDVTLAEDRSALSSS
jgi:drug/metabolite transporter (DMT)-like permease